MGRNWCYDWLIFKLWLTHFQICRCTWEGHILFLLKEIRKEKSTRRSESAFLQLSSQQVTMGLNFFQSGILIFVCLSGFYRLGHRKCSKAKAGFNSVHCRSTIKPVAWCTTTLQCIEISHGLVPSLFAQSSVHHCSGVHRAGNILEKLSYGPDGMSQDTHWWAWIW